MNDQQEGLLTDINAVYSSNLGVEAKPINEQLIHQMQKYLAEARDRLIDRNLRNKLINTSLQSSRTSNLRIWGELSDQVFECLVAKKIGMTFQHIPDSANADSEKDNESLLDIIDDQELSLHDDSDRHTDTALQTKLTKSGLEKKLRAQFYESSDYEEEQGVNILFLALGFLKWYEDSNSDIERFAPLVLLPVELVREGAKERYKLKLRDEDMMTNVSLKLWLKEQHAIDLPELPENDLWKPSEYFHEVRQSISKAKRWEVFENDIVLGFFSFSKFLLWKDLDPANWPVGQGLLDHPVLQKLLGKSADSETIERDSPLIPDGEMIDDHYSPHDLVYVLDADSSQTEAIQTSLAGKDLVIQGPPGTGKSQTITNIIVSAVSQGKKVLFIAEKMAALDVVHQRLQKCNLAPLCFELHSRKASKSSVLAQLKASIDLAYQPINPKDRIELLAKTQTVLNGHAKRLNTPTDKWGFTPFEVLGAISKLERDGIEPSDYSIPNAETYTKEKLNQFEYNLQSLVERLKVSGVPAIHPWRYSEKNALNPLDQKRLEGLLNECITETNSLIISVSQVGMILNACEIYSENSGIEQINDLIHLHQKLIASPKLHADLICSREIRGSVNDLLSVTKLIKTYQEISPELHAQFIKGWLQVDFSSLRIRFAGSGGSIFSIFKEQYRNSLAELKGLSLAPLPKNFQSRLKLIDKACEAIEIKSKIDAFDRNLISALGSIWQSELSVVTLLESTAKWHQQLLSLTDDQFEILRRMIGIDDALTIVEKLPKQLSNRERLLQALCNLVSVDSCHLDGSNLINEQELLKTWLGTILRFNEWPPVRDLLKELCPLLGDDFYEAIYQGQIQPADLVSSVRISILEAIWDGMVEAFPDITTLDGQTLNQYLQQFRSLDKERLSISSKEVLSAYVTKRPSGFAGDMGIIRQELNKKRNHLPVRKLLAKSGRAIQELKPVFLMSPMSLAQYIAPGSLMFDLILIDEASQVRPEDALGAIARAKQIVVVGDDKQLPPTNFFNRLTDDSSPLIEDDDNFALSNLESVLSLCNIVLPNQCMLRWHYRSQHPGLITVSNRNFYENKLLLPPSTLRESFADGMGVSMVKSPSNSYERGGSNGGRNVVEAEMIAKAVIAFAKENPDLSLGIAAFSVRQRDAIRDLVDNYRRRHPELESFFSNDRPEPFFIKNLESIQGDERDVIFISVGYGRDQSGRLTQTFGPLGQDGGERRLNVLVSRAKIRCTVFSSITSEDVKPTPGNLGVSAFKEFLQYAEKGYFDSPENTNRDFDSDFEESVASFLKRHGYSIQPQVGMAGFFIDIGVIDPRNENKFICGIECDGATYHSSRSARDRDRLRQSILESRGWSIYRIWSTDWFHRQSEQEAKLLDYLHSLVKNGPQKITTPSAAEEYPNDFPDNEKQETPPLSRSENNDDIVNKVNYIEFTETVNSKKMPHEIPTSSLALIVRKIVEIEGPIHEDEVSRRVAKSFGLERTGGRIQDATKKALRSSGLKNSSGFWNTFDQKKVPVRNRSNVTAKTILAAENLPPEEIREALLNILKESIRVHEDELIQHTSRMFGFNRCGPDIKSAISKVLNKSMEFVKDADGYVVTAT